MFENTSDECLLSDNMEIIHSTKVFEMHKYIGQNTDESSLRSHQRLEALNFWNLTRFNLNNKQRRKIFKQSQNP